MGHTKESCYIVSREQNLEGEGGRVSAANLMKYPMWVCRFYVDGRALIPGVKGSGIQEYREA